MSFLNRPTRASIRAWAMSQIPFEESIWNAHAKLYRWEGGVSLSFVVNAKDHDRAEKWTVAVGEVREVISGVVPKTFAGNAYTLACYLTNQTLNNDLVCGDIQILYMGANIVHNLLCLALGFHMIVLLAFKITFHNIFHNLLDLARIETKAKP